MSPGRMRATSAGEPVATEDTQIPENSSSPDSATPLMPMDSTSLPSDSCSTTARVSSRPMAKYCVAESSAA